MDQITTEQITQLRLFMKKADQLFDHELIANQELGLLTKLSWNQVDGILHIEQKRFDVHKLESLALRLRIFFLSDEQVHFDKIANIASQAIGRHPIDNWNSATIRELKRDFRETRGDFLQLNVGDKTYKSQEIFDLLIYGEMFHLDKKKRATLEEISTPQTERFLYDMFVSSAISKIECLNYLQWLVGTLLQKIDESNAEGNTA